jgi:nucleoside-diphosphate-sugar epimerase
MAHYLVTGVAGFIGSRTAELLLDAGHTVVGIDNLNDAYDVGLKRWRLAQLAGRPGLRFVHGDITQRADLADLFSDTEPFAAVINLAARAGVRYSVQNPWIYQETNVVGTLNLLEACREYRVGKFVQASTSSLYGNRNPVPYQESQNTDFPLSPYAASKKAAEALCASYNHLHQIDVSVLRYFTVYGPASRPDMSPFRFVQRIVEGRPITVYGDGSQSRDFTYVDDIARGTIAALAPVGYDVFNLGSDTPFALREMIALIERLTGQTAAIVYQPAHAADMPRTWADISKAAAMLGWRPQVRFEAGFQALVDWYLANREWAQHVGTVD